VCLFELRVFYHVESLAWIEAKNLHFFLGFHVHIFFYFIFSPSGGHTTLFLFIFFFFFLRKYPTKSQAPSCLATAVSAAAVWGDFYKKSPVLLVSLH
jgi:hypothetical protein